MRHKLKIDGMHCVSCEVLVEKSISKLKDAKVHEVCHKKGFLEVECFDEKTLQDIFKIIKKHGYQYSSCKIKNVPKNTFPDYLQIIFILIGVIALAYLVDAINIYQYFPNFGDKVNVFIAFLLGLVASLSTCLALVGGIVMGFGTLYPVARLKPHLYFHAGRVLGFAFLGGLLGLIGNKVNLSVSLTGYFTILVAIIMLYIGLQILNLVPNITKLGFHLPKSFSRKIHALEEKNHFAMPAIIGVLTFFLPCGFTQSMQLAAVISQDFVTGAAIMGAFALGTLPVLFSIGVGSTFAKRSNFNFFIKFIGVIIVAFAMYSFNSGLVLAGSSFTLDFWKNTSSATNAVISNNEQIVQMTVDWNFSPTEFKVVKNIPVRWEINGINISGCSNEIVIPKLNIRQKIQKGLNVINFTPTQEGILPFSCWMGMLNGRFIITDEKGSFSDVSAKKIKTELAKPITQGSCNGSCGDPTCGAAKGGSCGCSSR